MVYLLHFEKPIPRGTSKTGKPLTCGHYLGSTDNLEERLEHHRTGNGARLMEVCKDRGIGFTLARTWEGGRHEERKLKARKEMPRLCPLCNGNVNYRKMKV
jgi:hypothetical protein